LVVCAERTPKRKPRRQWATGEKRRSTRLELKRQEIEQLLVAEQISLDDALSDYSDGPSPKRIRHQPAGVEDCLDSNLRPIADQETAVQPEAVDDALEQVKVESATSEVLNAADDDGQVPLPIVNRKRGRGRPRKIRRETTTPPDASNLGIVTVSATSSADDVTQLQDVLSKTDCTAELCGVPGGAEFGTAAPQQLANLPFAVGGEPSEPGAANTSLQPMTTQPQPMTLSLSPPPLPSGKVPQPAGVLLLPLYSSTPTEPGEQSSLMVVQPHQLATLPFTEPGTGRSLQPILPSNQTMPNPFVSSAGAGPQPAVYVLPTTAQQPTDPS